MENEEKLMTGEEGFRVIAEMIIPAQEVCRMG